MGLRICNLATHKSRVSIISAILYNCHAIILFMILLIVLHIMYGLYSFLVINNNNLSQKLMNVHTMPLHTMRQKIDIAILAPICFRTQTNYFIRLVDTRKF